MRLPTASRMRMTPRRLALLITIVGSLVLGLVRVAPASAYTVERTPGKILFTSKRLHANTVRVTVFMAFYDNGNFEQRYEVHNGARIAKAYEAGGQIKIRGMFLLAQDSTGRQTIAGRRNDEWDTLYGYGHDHRLVERWAQLNDGAFEVNFWLTADWKFTGGEGPNDWGTCETSICELQD